MTFKTWLFGDFPWTWSEVSTTDATVVELDRKFTASDLRVQYFLTLSLLALTWALILTVFIVDDLTGTTQRVVVAAFALALVLLSIAVSIWRMLVIKYGLLHPALKATGVPGDAGRRFMACSVSVFVVAMVGTVAAGICLVQDSNKAQAAGLGLCLTVTLLFILALFLYRRHAGVHMEQWRNPR